MYKKKLLVFIGPDGCGKTTVINNLNEQIKSSNNVLIKHTTFGYIKRFDHLLVKFRNSFFSIKKMKNNSKENYYYSLISSY